jgi:DNA topoisomerase I
MVSRERTLRPGWATTYGRYINEDGPDLSKVMEGDRFKVAEVNVEERLEQGPPRYDQSTLLEKMERENIGTKGTRADVISTLSERGYVEGTEMKVTDLGLAVVEAMQRNVPSILTTGLTREVEGEVERVEQGIAGDANVVRETVRSIAEQLVRLRASEDQVGQTLTAANSAESDGSHTLGPCPTCKSGQLIMIRSRRTGKRFVGCSNYSKGCRASAPLPQRGIIRISPKACPDCSWPIVTLTRGRRPWRLCINVLCPTRRWEKARHSKGDVRSKPLLVEEMKGPAGRIELNATDLRAEGQRK